MKPKANHHYANLPIRFMASVIDFQIVWMITLLGTLFFFHSISLPVLITSVINYITFWFLPLTLLTILYSPYMHSRFGSTLGQFAAGIKTVSTTYQLLTFKQALFRHLFATLPISATFGFGYLSILFNDRHQGWHDQISGTYVTIIKPRFFFAIVISVSLLISQAGIFYYLIFQNFFS